MTEHMFRLPDRSAPTENEMAWLELLRDLTCGRDPAPTSRAITALRSALMTEASGLDVTEGQGDGRRG